MKRSVTAAIIIWGVIAVLLLMGGCGKSNGDSNATEEKTERVVSVKVEVLKPRSFTDAIIVTGTIRAEGDVMISPEEGGVIKEWLVEKGQPVKKGQIIGILNDDLMQANYDAAAAQYKLSELNFGMQKEVFQEKAISELQYKNAEYGRDAAKAQADMMRARLERTRIKSPIDGILNDRLKNAGEFAPPMLPVAHVVNLRDIKAVSEVSEKYAGLMKVGNLATIVPDAFPNDSLKGRIVFVGAAISPNNRTFPVEIAIPNPGYRLKPEMIVRISIINTIRKDALLVGEGILQEVDRNKTVVYVENNGKAEERSVRLGGRQGTMREIVDGLRVGDRVIVSGFQKLVHGQAVQVVE